MCAKACVPEPHTVVAQMALVDWAARSGVICIKSNHDSVTLQVRPRSDVYDCCVPELSELPELPELLSCRSTGPSGTTKCTPCSISPQRGGELLRHASVLCSYCRMIRYCDCSYCDCGC